MTATWVAPRIDRGTGPGEARANAASIGLWVFMGVVTALFSLFAMAYLMRMNSSDAVTLALPRQLWISTALLVAGSLALQRASAAARRADAMRTRGLLLAGGLCAIAFLCAQLWAWNALLNAQVMPAGNPAGSFFYLLTAMHGLHVAGGLIAWGWVMRTFRRETIDGGWRIALCARYWHFMLAVWLALFALLAWVTPEVARFICGTV
ncbi:cytochrome c oxidase subunit 3 [Variovorax sp. YR216]|uniref:cytochrome c oxidase subunit 3 n=1 Tax=Variovorax sp. YR216 TaxID=1882828 RepID=UPI0008972BAD|nr:cytochrome c oxidase subunit 3 [Variovorax sp. YR216]SEB11673.1 cytochrome c oxidase subunit 3 [Variovorax sp. YR216]